MRFVITRDKSHLLPITPEGYFGVQDLGEGQGRAIVYSGPNVSGVLVSGLQDDSQHILAMTHVADWLTGLETVLDLNSWWAGVLRDVHGGQ